MTVTQLQLDLEEYFKSFRKFPLKETWRRRDSRACLAVFILCLAAIALSFYYLASMPLLYVFSLAVTLVFTTICAVRMGEVCTQIRAESFGEDVSTSFAQLRQRWMCERYKCNPSDLVDKARSFRAIWEERQEILRLANDDTMEPRLFAFFSFPESSRFVAMLVAVVAVFATVVTLGSDIDSVFEILVSSSGSIFINVVVFTLLAAEIIILWIMVSGIARIVGQSLLEQFNILPLTKRRVYSYLLSIHIASEPMSPENSRLSFLLKIVSIFFTPLPLLLKGRSSDKLDPQCIAMPGESLNEAGEIRGP